MKLKTTKYYKPSYGKKLSELFGQPNTFAHLCIKGRSLVVKKLIQLCLTQQTPNLLDYGILLICHTYCLFLELVPCRTCFGNVYFICVCLEAISSESEPEVLLNSKVVFTW